MHREPFQSLTHARAPKRALGASVGLHVVLLLVVILFPLLAPQTLRVRYNTIVTAPPPDRLQSTESVQIRLPVPAPLPRPIQHEPELIVEKPVVIPPKAVTREPQPQALESIPAPPVPAVAAAMVATVPEPKAAAVAAPPPPPVVTNVFSSAAPAVVVTARPGSVEVARFGDVEHSAGRSGRSETISAAGFGDAVETGVRVVRAGRMQGAGTLNGFDVGPAAGGRPGATGTVVNAGFATATSAPRSSSAVPRSPEVVSEKPVEVLSKPRPDYTDEARRMRVEGDVLLRVLFTSSGSARVLDVIRGLGYGLDENAIRAAEQIRFKPAQHGGQPVDSTVIVHIAFQLAY
jgi:TonB family protein